MQAIYPNLASTSLLAREMVRIEGRMAQAKRLGFLDQVAVLERYRGAVRDYRSALMRGEDVPVMVICPSCNRLIAQEVYDGGQRCPWCDEWTQEHGRVGA